MMKDISQLVEPPGKLSDSIIKRKALIAWHVEKDGSFGIVKDLASRNVIQREILRALGGSTNAEGGPSND